MLNCLSNLLLDVSTLTTQPFGDQVVKLSVDQVLEPYVYVFYAAFIVAFAFTPIMRSIAIYFNIIDKPDLVRKLHTSPVAYLGGVAVFLGWLAGIAMTQLVVIHGPVKEGWDDRLRIPVGIVAAALMIVGLGLFDDIKQASPKFKIAGQMLAGVALLLSGVGDSITGPFLNNVFVRLDVKLGLAVSSDIREMMIFASSWVLTVTLVVFCCNASNLMDGLDGLCGGVTGIIAIGFVFLAVWIARFYPTELGFERINQDGVRVVVALALLGGVLGFVPYNFNPASIFMGDTGSMFLGLMCALMIVMLGEVHGKWLLAGMVMFALPVLDTSLAFARRYVAGRPFFSPDRHHFHHQLVNRGLSVRKAVLVSYALTTFFVACGIMICFFRTRYAVAFYMVLFGSISVAAYKMGMIHEQAKVLDRPSNLLSNSTSSSTAAGIAPDNVLEIRKDQPVA